MNLIEQLGGYEKAKTIFENKPKYAQGWWNGIYYKQGEWCWWWSEYLKKWLQHEKHIGNSTKYTHSIKIPDIQQALLEHRRAHNTFEVGDKVVLVGDGTWEHLFEVEKMSPKGRKPTKLKTDVFGNYHVGYNIVRHATSEEIKAGRRL